MVRFIVMVMVRAVLRVIVRVRLVIVTIRVRVERIIRAPMRDKSRFVFD